MNEVEKISTIQRIAQRNLYCEIWCADGEHILVYPGDGVNAPDSYKLGDKVRIRFLNLHESNRWAIIGRAE